MHLKTQNLRLLATVCLGGLAAACGGGGNGGLSQPVVNPIPVSNTPPVVSLSVDRGALQEGRSLTLDASQSSDVDGDSLIYSWSQISGPSAKLVGQGTPVLVATFSDVQTDETARFEVVVADGTDTSAEIVEVDVKNIILPGLETTTFFNRIVDLPTDGIPTQIGEGPSMKFDDTTFLSQTYMVLQTDEAGTESRVTQYYTNDAGQSKIVANADFSDFNVDVKTGSPWRSVRNFNHPFFSEADNSVTVLLADPDNGTFFDDVSTEVTIPSPCAISYMDGTFSPTGDKIQIYAVGTRTGLYLLEVTKTGDGASAQLSGEAFLREESGSYCSFSDIEFAYLPDNSSFQRSSDIITINDETDRISIYKYDFSRTFGSYAFPELVTEQSYDVGVLQGLKIIDTSFKKWSKSTRQRSFFVLASDGEVDGRHVLARVQFARTSGSDEAAQGAIEILESVEWTGGQATAIIPAEAFQAATTDFQSDPKLQIVVIDPLSPYLRVQDIAFNPCVNGNGFISSTLCYEFDGAMDFLPTELGASSAYTNLIANPPGFVIAYPNKRKLQIYARTR